jgi:RHS repeat-associated protein
MYYNAQVVSVSDYYPFGMGIKEREWKDSTFSYRFGFNGKEGDDEVSGSGNSYDYGFRIYNPRLGRFLSVDPLFKTFPFYTPYQFAANMPIAAIDLDGAEGEIVINSPYYEGEINKAVEAGDMDEAVLLSAKSLNDPRPSGEYAKKAYGGAGTAGSWNYNEANTKNLTVYNKKGEILFSQGYIVPEPSDDGFDLSPDGLYIYAMELYYAVTTPDNSPYEVGGGIAFYGSNGQGIETRKVGEDSEGFAETRSVDIGPILAVLGGGNITSPGNKADAVAQAIGTLVTAFEKGRDLGDGLGTESPYDDKSPGNSTDNTSLKEELDDTKNDAQKESKSGVRVFNHPKDTSLKVSPEGDSTIIIQTGEGINGHPINLATPELQGGARDGSIPIR